MSELQLEPQLVKAGAGTGKTTYLVNEVHSLFRKFRDKKGRDPRLIVCTFTRKASQELKERLFEMAVKGLSKKEEQTSKQKASGEEKQNPRKETNNTQENQSLFLNYIQSPSLHISTIDGILNLFLRRYGHRIDLSPDFQLSHGQASESLFDSLAEEFVFEKNFSLLKKIPYPFLKELFLFYFRSCLKYGKVSFYNKKDFEEFNQDRKLFLEAKDLLKKGNKQNFDIIKVKQSFEKHNSPLAKLLNEDKDIGRFKKIFTEEEKFQVDEFLPLFEEFHQAGKEFFLSFMEKKKSKALLDMDDQLLFSLDLLRESPKTAQDFSGEWDYWLIDEYQDTSWIQEQIIDRITGFENVLCVGDPAQSIYLFRSADPRVFKRREESLGKPVKKLDTNYRSSAELIYFYNDFFPKNKDFMKFKPPENKQAFVDKPCVYFLTYEKNKEQKDQYNQQSLTALYHYIQKLITEGSSYSDIAVLSLKNDNLAEIADYLRRQNLPLILYSSKNFAQKRLILDALFLLKFLINPYDNTNLKALLRTPYFRLSDQELADSSYEHFKLCGNKEPISFWSFVKTNFSDRIIIKSLSSYLEWTKERGFVRSFEKALMDSGLMDLSYFQDPTGSSESNLWKLLYLLNKNSFSALELFYSLMDEGNEEGFNNEAPPCESSESIELMTIHKSKGLEFKHIIVMDFSIADSSLRSGDKTKDLIIYDEIKQKMAFAVPVGGRDNPKVKSYGHEIYNKTKEEEKLFEKERFFYVAMTRAKQSLALFIPNSPPEQNSWLSRVSFFKEFVGSEGHHTLLEEQYNKKDKKLKSWKLNEGHYRTSHYSFCVKSSESICQSPDQFIDSDRKSKSSFTVKKASELESLSLIKEVKERSESESPSLIKKAEGKEENLVVTGEDQSFKARSKIIPGSEEDFINSVKDSKVISLSKKEGQKKEIPILTGVEKYFKGSALQIKSSKDFVDDIEKDQFSGEGMEAYESAQPIKAKKGSDEILYRQDVDLQKPEISNEKPENNFQENPAQQKETFSPVYLSKTKNILFKTHLGRHLHLFLQRLSYQSFERIQSFIKDSFLSKEDQKKIKQALIYIIELKEPQMNLFLKTGFSEWPFKCQKQNVLLQGRIDLWGWDSDEIHLFDYKSSISQSSQTEKQLIFYSWILDEFYHPKNVWMYEVYPFQQTIRKKLYDSSHKKMFENWLKKAGSKSAGFF